MKTVVTIGRQYGSGGREIGLRLAKKLNVPFYDKELLQKAAEESGLCEKIFDQFDEKPRSVLYSIAMDSYLFTMPGTGVGESLEQQVYLATYNTIRRVADRGPCVLIGRCADHALADRPNLLTVFVGAPLNMRIQTVERRENVPAEKAKTLISRTDKRRAAYYEYYSSQKWGSVNSYDFCLNSALFGTDGSVELIQRIIEMKEA